jgi:hypothetical protein
MSAAFGLDALFSRKGEAAPAVQPAIPNTGRNRFEDLARALGHSVDPDSDTDAFDDEAGPRPADSGDDGRVTPFRRPAEAGSEASTAPTAPRAAPEAVPADTGDEDGDGSDDDETAASVDAADHAAAIGYGMIRRAKPAGDAPVKPWESVRQALSRRAQSAEAPPPRRGAALSVEAARPDAWDAPPWVTLKGSATGTRQTLTAAAGTDPEDIEIFLFGPEQAGGTLAPDADGSQTRRRHVSVRLPAREHELLRQFARLSGSTQQDVLRRSLLTYMIEELRRRLETTLGTGPKTRG